MSPKCTVSSSCGSGLSGDYISEEGHYWVGIDISPAMLGKCVCPALYQGRYPLLCGASELDFCLFEIRSCYVAQLVSSLGCSRLSLPVTELTGLPTTPVCLSSTHALFSSNVDAALDRDTEGDLLLGDMGQGVPFRPGSFDGCIR